MVHTGVKVFERNSQARTSMEFRVCQEGLGLVLPYMTQRVSRWGVGHAANVCCCCCCGCFKCHPQARATPPTSRGRPGPLSTRAYKLISLLFRMLQRTFVYTPGSIRTSSEKGSEVPVVKSPSPPFVCDFICGFGWHPPKEPPAPPPRKQAWKYGLLLSPPRPRYVGVSFLVLSACPRCLQASICR